MSRRFFGEVTDVLCNEDGDDCVVTIRLDRGDHPGVGDRAQVMTGFLAAQGCLATSDHNALVDAREFVCLAVRSQIALPDSYERQQRMIAVLQRIDELLRPVQEA